MIGSKEDARALDYALRQADNEFRMRFEDAEESTQFYYKDRAGEYHEVDTWLVPYKTAELIHSDIVRPLILQIALELKKIEAYELPYKKEENETEE